MTTVNTANLVDDIRFLSIDDRKQPYLANEDKLVLYRQICEEMNIFAQVSGTELITGYQQSFTSYTSQNGYAIISTPFWAVSNVTFIWNNTINKYLTHQDNETFFNNIKYTALVGIPQCWTFYLPTQSIYIYPVPSISGTFVALGSPQIPEISVSFDGTNFTFTPSTLDLPVELNFVKYMKYSVAQAICAAFNVSFGEERERALNVLHKTLRSNNRATFKPFSTLAPVISNTGFATRKGSGGWEGYVP